MIKVRALLSLNSQSLHRRCRILFLSDRDVIFRVLLVSSPPSTAALAVTKLLRMNTGGGASLEFNFVVSLSDVVQFSSDWQSGRPTGRGKVFGKFRMLCSGLRSEQLFSPIRFVITPHSDWAQEIFFETSLGQLKQRMKPEASTLFGDWSPLQFSTHTHTYTHNVHEFVDGSWFFLSLCC